MPNLPALILACTNGVAPATVAAIISVESAGNPHAIATNPHTPFARPTTLAQAQRTLHDLMRKGLNTDIGIMQVNSQHLKRLNIEASELLDPCTNIFFGTSLLKEKYQRATRKHSDPQEALRAALSAYNTGSLTRGFKNGYVDKVLTAAGLASERRLPAISAAALKSPISVPFHTKGETHGRSAVPEKSRATWHIRSSTSRSEQ